MSGRPGVDDAEGCGQAYLGPAPKGIDARFAWAHEGGDGKGIRLADVEWGWNHDHVDLAGLEFIKAGGRHYKALAHGTRVLGVIAAQNNSFPFGGIAPNVQSIVTVGQWQSDQEIMTAEAVWQAIDLLRPGDVLLLETQTDLFGYSDIPLEAEHAVYEAVSHATSRGITVVAAAGNGGANLDAVTDGSGKYIFDREVRDSGAILVGSASPTSDPAWQPMKSSCFGKRIDCFAWGSNVRTLSTSYDGKDNAGYTTSFNLTSAAAAIVAGAALSLQGITLARHGRCQDPATLRRLLSAPELNTPSAEPEKDFIGVMPDLRKIIGDCQ